MTIALADVEQSAGDHHQLPFGRPESLHRHGRVDGRRRGIPRYPAAIHPTRSRSQRNRVARGRGPCCRRRSDASTTLSSWNTKESPAACASWGLLNPAFAGYPDLAGIRLVDTGQDLDERRLAGPVLADQAVRPRPGATSRSTPRRAWTPGKLFSMPASSRTGWRSGSSQGTLRLGEGPVRQPVHGWTPRPGERGCYGVRSMVEKYSAREELLERRQVVRVEDGRLDEDVAVRVPRSCARDDLAEGLDRSPARAPCGRLATASLRALSGSTSSRTSGSLPSWLVRNTLSDVPRSAP